MNYEEACENLKDITKGMKYIPFVNYAAIIEIENEDNSIDYFIECGIETRDQINYNFPSFNTCHEDKWGQREITPPELVDYAMNSPLATFYDSEINSTSASLNKSYLDFKINKKTKYLNFPSSGIKLFNDDSRLMFNIADKITNSISIGNKNIDNKGGTLGAIFKLQNDDNYYGITNAHVIHENRCRKGGLIVNPAVSHTEDQEYSQTQTIGKLNRYFLNEDMDLGIFNFIEKLGCDIGNCKNKVTICGIETPKLKSNVFKEGIRTGRQSGKIRSLNASCRIEIIKNDKRKVLVMENQIMIERMKSGGGDSGSTILNKDNNVIGLYFGSDLLTQRSFFTPIDKIFDTKNGNPIHLNPPYLLEQFINP
jgi:hypothetical protein